MNILELDSYNLEDAVKFNNTLNPKLWDSAEHLKPEVRNRLLEIAEDFQEFLGINNLQLKDITVSGSNAAYTYTPHSDIDLHLVVDLPEADRSEVYRELFDAKKYQYNDMHNIKIGNYDVELYVQNANEAHVSQGIYSVLHNKWISVPNRRKPKIDDISVKSKFEDLGHRIENAVASKDYTKINNLAKKIKDYRQAGLDAHGEFGAENLAFKILRKQGKIKELYDARNAARDAELSLKEKVTKPQKFTYGFKTEDAGMTWDGVGPTTDMFTTENTVEPTPSNEEILKDFIHFCVEELKIEKMPTIKLRKDPQWPVVHKTFGRYINDQHLLEVAWGQRHIMDVLRTVAHELTHKHQHERDGKRMGPDAGETGSPYENEANARAGILMRDYARLHPEYFAIGQAQDLKEDELDESLKTTAGATAVVACLIAGGSLSGCATQPQQTTQQLLRTTQDVGRVTMAAKNITRAGTEAEVRQELDNLSRAAYGDSGAANVSSILRIWHKLQGRTPVQPEPDPPEYGPALPVRRMPQYESASGYIPTKKQARDPRYKMALTVDIHPGQLGKEANKLRLKTDSQGHPQIANPNGLFEKLALELNQFKRNGTLAESTEMLDEVKMSPSALMKWATSPEAKGIRAGFEAELIFRDTDNNGDDDYEMEPDYDQDERCRSIQQVIDFFQNGDYGGLSPRQERALQEGLDEQYFEWQDEQMYAAWRDERDDLIREAWLKEKPMEERIHAALVDGMDLSDDQADAVVALHDARAKKEITGPELSDEQLEMASQYSEAAGIADDILDEDVEQTIAKEDGFYDEVLQDFRDGFYIDDDSGFFDDVGLRWMSDVSNSFDLEWPYMTGGGGNDGSRSWEEIGDSLNGAIDMPVKVSSNYHSTLRREGQWIVEPDSSLHPDSSEDCGLEIVSPPMPLLTALEKLQQVCDWANDGRGDAYTNESTGLHMGVSVPYKGGDVDYLKLILFLGDEYVLQAFGREANTYCASAMKKFKQNIKGGRTDPMSVINLMQHGLLELAYKEVQKGVGGGKYTSAHIKDGYIEFRSAGGDWLAEESADPEKLSSTMLRFARAMQIAANPAEERREYAKKLYKLVAPEGDSELALFSQYAAGELTAEQLKKRWAEKTIGAEKKMNQRWKLYQNVDGRWEPVPAAEWNGYTEDQVKNAVWSKYGREALDSGEYQLVNMGEQDWEVYDVKTGKTLEIVKGKSKGEVADAVYDKYVNQGVGFQVRPYTDPATLTPRAKLAKRIAEPKPKSDWEVIYKPTGRVIDTIMRVDKNEAERLLAKVATLHDFENADDLAIRPQTAERPQSADDRQDSAHLQATLTRSPFHDTDIDVAQNFAGSEDPFAAYERNSDRINAVRARQDATNRIGSWSIYDVTLGRELSRMDNVAWSQADARANEIERGTGHNISVRGLSENLVENLINTLINLEYSAWALMETAGPVQFVRSKMFDETMAKKARQAPNVEAKLQEFITTKQQNPLQPWGSKDKPFPADGPIGRMFPKLRYAHLTSDIILFYTMEGRDPITFKLYGVFSHDDIGIGMPRNINRQKSLLKKLAGQPVVVEGEVIPFRRSPTQAAWQKITPDVLQLANDWFWANEDSNGLQAVMDPNGLGNGIDNDLKYIQARLQTKGWSIDFDNEINNIILSNRQGQTVALPISDAYDGHGWAQGTLAENFADGKGPGRAGDSQRHGIPKGATMAELEKASHAKGRKGQLARWQLNMRRGKAKKK